MKQSLGDRVQRFHNFLRRLRAGGRSNMYGAIPYLMHAFELDRERAFRIVCEWVDQQHGASAAARGDAQDAAELVGAVTEATPPRPPERTPAPAGTGRKRSRTRG